MIPLPPMRVAPQLAMAVPSYDNWMGADGAILAQFYRQKSAFVIRFAGKADFVINRDSLAAECLLPDENARDVAEALWHNAIVPLIGNHQGQLHLHGSAVVMGERSACAFLGPSRSGKTTLAGALAKAGHPFLTEDVVALDIHDDGLPYVQPSRPVLRLFADSAQMLFEAETVPGTAASTQLGKRELPIGANLPFASTAHRLDRIYLLGSGNCSEISIAAVPAARFMAESMQHAFVLDVEDAERLRGHFHRLGDLAAKVPCYRLNFPRDFSQIDALIMAIRRHHSEESTRHDA